MRLSRPLPLQSKRNRHASEGQSLKVTTRRPREGRSRRKGERYDTRAPDPPPVAIGHASLRVTDIPHATQYFVTLGLRLIHQAQSIAVLELRGGTHLVLRPSAEPIAPGAKAPFDLMVDDLTGARREYEAAGLKPSEIETGMVHRWFTLVGTDGYELTVTSSHTAGRAV